LPLVTVTAVIYTSPIILVLISTHLLSEKLSKINILAVCAGFGGILMISRPSEMNIYIAMAFVGAITIALNSVCLKRIADKEHPMVTLFWSNVYSVIFIIPLTLIEDMPVSLEVMSTGFYLAMLSIVATYLAIHALRRADASKLAPAEYSGLVFAAVLGYWLFDDAIGAWTLTGILIVISSVVIPSKFIRRNQPRQCLKETN
jgi:drug/metabolite transporter (DMT)-like permease